MKTNTTTTLTIEPNQELLPWHKPKITRLSVNLDTAAAQGSGSDGTISTVSNNSNAQPSDRQLKKNITPIKDALNGVLSLQGVNYSYDAATHPELGLSTEPQVGFIAQELEQVYPELVVTRDNGFKAVNYAQLVPVLVEAIKQQQAMIEELQQHMNELQQNAVEITKE